MYFFSVQNCKDWDSSSRKASEREDKTAGDDTVQPGRKANIATFTTVLIINLHLDTGRSTKTIKKENEKKKKLNIDRDPTEVNISHKNMLEGGVKKNDIQLLQQWNCSELTFLPCSFYTSAAPLIIATAH